MKNLQKRMKKLGNKKGFTLVELIVVIAIIGVLAVVLVPKLGGFGDKAKGAGALTEAKQVATAADSLLIEKGKLVPEDAGEVEKLAGVKAGSVTSIADANKDGLVEFTYTTKVKEKDFTVTRSNTGDFKVEETKPAPPENQDKRE